MNASAATQSAAHALDVAIKQRTSALNHLLNAARFWRTCHNMDAQLHGDLVAKAVAQLVGAIEAYDLTTIAEQRAKEAWMNAQMLDAFSPTVHSS